MQFINDMFHWWYINESIIAECPNGLAIAMYSMGTLSIIVWLLGCIIGEWKNEGGVIGGFFIIGLIGIILCLAIALGGPILVVLSFVFGFGYGLQAIGDFFRKSAKVKEFNGIKALEELIKSDPDFKAKYDEAMKNSPNL